MIFYGILLFFYVFGKNKTLNKFADAGFYGASAEEKYVNL